MTKNPQSEAFKDLFSRQSADYSKYRPTYPATLYAFLAGLTPWHERCWDCGTGNGQAAVELKNHYDQIIATDPSEKQLAQATQMPGIDYRKTTAEHSGIASGSIDLVTVAQAYHWFDHPKFHEEVKRVAKPSHSALAVWSYELCRITPEVDSLVRRFYTGPIGSFWEPERRHVETRYAAIAVPFKELSTPVFEMHADWSCDQLLGYLNTWSATQAAIRALGHNPIDAITNELRALWPANEIRGVSWPLALRVFKIN